MKVSHFYLKTQKEVPSDAHLLSHQFMLRAGLIQPLSSGIYSWLPLGLRVLRRVETIVREEMNRSGALEVLLPAVQPAELWKESERWHQYGPELLRFTDRHDHDCCLGPTHEEVITDVMRKELASYKSLPVTVYQIQTKFRDEIRPRFGVLRGREFVMKDAYSFDLDAESLQQSYTVMYDAYRRIFTRLGLHFRAVEADTGNIGGHQSHEFQVLSDSGEDVIAYSDQSNYAANVELATTSPPPYATPSDKTMMLVDTPNQYTMQVLCEAHGMKACETIKTLMVQGVEQDLVALVLRGDHKLNEFKAEKHPLVHAPLTFADHALIKERIGVDPGSLGPVQLPCPVIIDRHAAAMPEFICGANETDKHYFHAVWDRDVQRANVLDLRLVQEGDLSPDGRGQLKFARGIEVGQVFALGDKYSRSMGLTVLDQEGKSITLQMGCYGIGISRIVGAAIEQHHDDRGIIWPAAMAPFDIALIPINQKKSSMVREKAEALHDELTCAGFDVLFDDREERAGVLFADMDLIGLPHRLVISEKGLKKGTIEYKSRSKEQPQDLPITQLLPFLKRRI